MLNRFRDWFAWRLANAALHLATDRYQRMIHEAILLGLEQAARDVEADGVNTQANPGIDFATAQKGYHDIAAARRQARESMTDALKTKARKEFDRTKGLSEAIAIQRAKGLAMVEAEHHAKAAVAQTTLERDMADAEARAASMRIGELEGERASLRQLVDWTREETPT